MSNFDVQAGNGRLYRLSEDKKAKEDAAEIARPVAARGRCGPRRRRARECRVPIRQRD